MHGIAVLMAMRWLIIACIMRVTIRSLFHFYPCNCNKLLATKKFWLMLATVTRITWLITECNKLSLSLQQPHSLSTCNNLILPLHSKKLSWFTHVITKCSLSLSLLNITELLFSLLKKDLAACSLEDNERSLSLVHTKMQWHSFSFMAQSP